MKYLVLMGSPREKGNTATLLNPFMRELDRRGGEVSYITLHKKKIKGCKECFHCQKVLDGPGCGQKDDMNDLYAEILVADVVVLATPIFTWFCPAEVKAVMDRCFALSKKYNDLENKPMLLSGKKVALITTYGDEADTGPDLFEAAVRRLCTYAQMEFAGHLGVRDVNGMEDFTEEQAVTEAKAFAAALAEQRANGESWIN